MMIYIANPTRYEVMPYARCGQRGLKLPRLSLGLWHNFGDVDDLSVAREMLCMAFDHGVTHFDLANNYGPPPGSAERNFGVILREQFANYRDELVISTKAGYLMWEGPYGEWGSRKYLLASLDQSLQRLGIDYVDIFYSHRFDPETPLEETMGALHSAVCQGKALYVGLSNYSAEQTTEAAAILNRLGTPCLIHQPRYSMFERTPEQGLLETLADAGIGCIAYSPLAQGVLTDRYLDGIPDDSRAAKEHGFLKAADVNATVIRRVRALREVARRRNQTMAQLAIAWLLREPRVTSVLVGVSRPAQLRDNLRSLERLDFSPEELAEIDAILG